MLPEIEKKIARVQLALLALFAWGLGFLYLVSTVLFDPVQLRWELFCFVWEALAFGLPLIIFRPIFRPIRRYVRDMEAGQAPTAEQAAVFQRRILSYPFKVGLIAFFGSIAAYALGCWQVRHFAHLPWEGVAITMICGVATGLIWAVLEYFLLEYYLRPLTALAAHVGGVPEPPERVSLAVKILAYSVALVIASVSFFGIAAYSRASRVLEQEVGANLTERLREAANLIGALPRSTRGELSDSWRWIAAEFRISPRGYLYLVDGSGRILATHPASLAPDVRSLAEERILPATGETILGSPEGYRTDRVDFSKIVSFVDIPGTRWKLVAIAPMRDISPQLVELLYAGIGAMGFAVLLSLGTGLLSTRSITTSIGEVTAAARAVAERRDLSQRVRFQTNDEVGVLARAFNGMAQEIEDYAEGLEQRVEARTQELRLRTEQLEAKNGELSDFLFVASHDMRSPLINLDGFSHALRDSLASLEDVIEESRRANGSHASPVEAAWPRLKEEIDESLDFILRSTGRMDLLVKALLELSRIEARAPAREVVDTKRQIEDVLAGFHFQLEQKRIRVAVSDLPPVVADPVRLQQVFGNLIDNAIKYMPEREEARIDIGCETSGAEHRFWVRDNGIGIRPQDREKVFRLFARVAPNGTAGDGVGLTAVRKIVEKHGGKVWVESNPSEGSTFFFTLPRTRPEEAAAVAA